MIWSDCYASLALAAAWTTRIRLGTGVAVAGLRLPTTTAAAIASINRMAPGRTFLAVGNGNTGWRLLGQGHCRWLPWKGSCALCEACWRASPSISNCEARRQRRRCRWGRPRFRRRGTSDSAGGIGVRSVCRAMRLAAELGDGVVTSLVGAAHISKARAAMGDRPVTGMTHAIVLRPGEAIDSPRVLEHAGATVLSTVHYLYDKWCDEGGATPPSALEPIWEEVRFRYRRAPARVRHQRVHAGHNTFVHPDERRFVIPELVDRFALGGHAGPVGAAAASFGGGRARRAARCCLIWSTAARGHRGLCSPCASPPVSTITRTKPRALCILSRPATVGFRPAT